MTEHTFGELVEHAKALAEGRDGMYWPSLNDHARTRYFNEVRTSWEQHDPAAELEYMRKQDEENAAEEEVALLLYAGTSGYSGSETSERRAREQDASGVTGKRQRAVHALLAKAKAYGRTDHEVQEDLGIGHGASSSALTALHKAGHIARLQVERYGNQVYVLGEHVNSRATSPYRPNGLALKAKVEALAAEWESTYGMEDAAARLRSLL